MPSRNPIPPGRFFSAGPAEPRPAVARAAPPAGLLDQQPGGADTARLDWLPWDTAAFARAQANHRPILLCLVTSWSAACRTLEAALATAPGLPRAVRDRVVLVRVDADRRPDIAERYTQGGWPTLLLLTPEGELLADALAGVNDPGAADDDDAAAAPARLVARVAETIVGASDAVRDHRRELALRAAAWRRERTAAADGGVAPDAADPGAGDALSRGAFEDTLARIATGIVSSFDSRHGGFCIGVEGKTREKFPHVGPIAFALWQGVRTADARLVEVGLTTLERMASGALSAADGAFHRCCHAADWSAPDEAVLLETQAELIPLYLDAWTIGGSDVCRARALACLTFVERVLEDEARGGFFASRAADGTVARVLPTDANARMVSALVRAGRVLEAPRLIERAARALERLLPVVYQRGAGVAHLLLPGSRDGRDDQGRDQAKDQAREQAKDQAQVRGLLRDQIEMSGALLDAGLAAGEPVYIELAEELMRSAQRRFAHPSGLLTDRLRTAAGAGDIGLLADALCPVSTNASAARILLRLGRDASRPDLWSAAHTTLSALSTSSHADHPIVIADLGLALLESLER